MCILLGGWVALCAPAWADARIDPLFAAWDQPDTPGLALAVLQDGKLVYSRGYGQAHLEYGVPITPATVFHAASLSKQFTAFAIHLLARDGKLSLEDDVRQHVPELQVRGPAIRIRHLMHHTSGLRDQWSLLTLAGLRLDDSITEADILALLLNQKELNFPPGDEELYSNSGYALLGLIVKRVSGQSLASFSREYIFEPLGMRNTHFQEDYGALVKGRAYSYRRSAGGWRYVALSFSNTGATSLFTTVEDLAKWDANLEDGRVGGKAVQEAMLTTGTLNDGGPIEYAGGLFKGRYRGLETVSHAGADAAYRSYILRFPGQRLTVLLLANASDVSAGALARQVANVYLESAPGFEPLRPAPSEVPLQARDLAPYLGDFQFPQGSVISFAAEGNQLVGHPAGQFKFTLYAAAEGSFFTRGSDSRLTFAAQPGSQPALSAVWRQDGREVVLKRLVRETPPAEALQACAGDYYSEELRTLYAVSLRGGRFMLRYPRGEIELKPVNRDVFAASYPLGTVLFKRNAAGQCESLGVTTGRVRNLRFDRVRLVPAG